MFNVLHLPRGLGKPSLQPFGLSLRLQTSNALSTYRFQSAALVLRYTTSLGGAPAQNLQQLVRTYACACVCASVLMHVRARGVYMRAIPPRTFHAQLVPRRVLYTCVKCAC